MLKQLIKNAKIVSDLQIIEGDLLISNGIIEKIAPQISADATMQVIDANGAYLIPGVIDDQVHFREPGLTHKANIYTEAKAAAAGGVQALWKCPIPILPLLPLNY
jgi:dihydroorotase